MSDADANAIAAAAKKRLRREARIRENYDRISAALSLSDSKSTKNQTRNIPDVPGFQSLSKTEIKRDTKDIEKNSSFSFAKERNYVDEMDACISRSMRPHCAAESTLLKKKRRLLSWVNNSVQADKEVDFWRASVTKSRDNLAQFEAARETWLDGFQEARRMLTGALKSSTEANKRLREEGVALHALCEQECGHALRKKRTYQTKDIVDELVERQNAYESSIQEYLGIAHELQAKQGPGAVPVSFLSLDEVHYPEDDVYIVNKLRARKAIEKTAPAVSSTAPEEHPVKVEAHVKVEEEAMEVVESETRECISEIPLPYFCSETRAVVSNSEPPEAEEAARTQTTAAIVAASNTRSKIRTGSIGSLKDLSSAPLVAVKNERSSSGGTTGDGLSESDAVANTNLSWSPSDAVGAGDTDVPARRSLDGQSLVELLLSLQETVRLNELSLTDVEFMFQDRTTCADDKTIIATILGHALEQKVKEEETKPSRSAREARHEGMTMEEQKVLAAPYLSLNRVQQHEWSSYCDQLFDGLNSQGIITRKGKKRGPEFMTVSVDLRLRTQRGVNLLLSPLSQYEDRMLGVSDHDTIYSTHVNQSTGQVTYHSTSQLPSNLRAAEEEALARCKLQSAAAIADLNLRKIRASLKEIVKFTQEAHSSLARSENLYEMASVEEGLELRKMYKELVHYGLVEAGLEDPPMSPISSNSAAVAASAMFSSVYGAAGGSNHGKAQSKGRAPPRVYARPAASSQAVSAAHADSAQDDVTSSESLTKSSSASDYDAKLGLEGGEEEGLKRRGGVAASTSATTSAPKRRR